LSVLLDWIKANVREGANLAEIEELLAGNTIDGIDSKEKAMKLLYEQKMMKAAFDSEISKKIANHDDRFMEEKLPSLLEQERERLRSEMNPELTPEQRELKEIKAQMAKIVSEKNMVDLRERLREKAKTINYDPDRAAKLAILGDFDKASEMMEEQATYLQATLDAERTKLVNERLGGNPPKGGESVDSSLTESKVANMSLAELEGEFMPNKKTLKGK